MARKRFKRRSKDDEEILDFVPVDPAPVIRLHFIEVSEPEEEEEPVVEPEPRPVSSRYEPVHRFDVHQIEATLDSMEEFEEEDEETFMAETERQVDRVIRGVPSKRETVVKQEVTEYVPKKKPAKKAPAKKKEPRCTALTKDGKKCKNPSKHGSKYCGAHKGYRPAPAKKKAPKKRPAAKKETLAQTAPKKKPAKKAPKQKPAPIPAPTPGEKDYQPQCAAITAGGVQCRNSSRKGSKYCASHKGYRPISAEAALARVDSRPRASKAKDTLPTKTTAATAKEHPQCGAITASGKQCRNSARTGSKYCASHKGYNPRSAVARMDTQPRWKKAEDTKPTLKD